MAFEVRPVAVSRRPRRWSVPAVLGVLGIVAGAAFVTADDGPGAVDPVAPPAARSDRPAGSDAAEVRSVGDGAAPPTSVPARPMPERIECHDLDRAACLRVARAALAAIPADAPSVLDATVWRSLLCSDDLECPSRYLEDSVPLGSVLLRFTDGGPRAAVNVVDWQPADGIRLGARAWLARWMPEIGNR
jgi:hypothetical protein